MTTPPPLTTALTRERLAQLAAGTLRLRPLGQPIYTPTGREKVAQVPQEWLQQETNSEVAQELEQGRLI